MWPNAVENMPVKSLAAQYANDETDTNGIDLLTMDQTPETGGKDRTCSPSNRVSTTTLMPRLTTLIGFDAFAANDGPNRAESPFAHRIV